MSKARAETFSDGVIAVAITLLALNIRVPLPRAHGSLAHELARQWPQYAAYVVSFLTIGIIWINHHAMLRRLASVDHAILALNLVLLMSTAFFALQQHTLRTNTELLDERITPRLRRALLRRNFTGLPPYAIATAAAALSPYVTLAICAAIAGFYAAPGTTFDVDALAGD